MAGRATREGCGDSSPEDRLTRCRNPGCGQPPGYASVTLPSDYRFSCPVRRQVEESVRWQHPAGSDRLDSFHLELFPFVGGHGLGNPAVPTRVQAPTVIPAVPLPKGVVVDDRDLARVAANPRRSVGFAIAAMAFSAKAGPGTGKASGPTFTALSLDRWCIPADSREDRCCQHGYRQEGSGSR